MTPMKLRRDALPARWRRVLTVVAAVAVLVAGYKVSDEQLGPVGSFGLPGATDDPTGPPGL